MVEIRDSGRYGCGITVASRGKKNYRNFLMDGA